MPIGCDVPLMCVKLALYEPLAAVVAIVWNAVLPAESVTVMPTYAPDTAVPVVVVNVPAIVTSAPCV
jgi:hypothetical protein